MFYYKKICIYSNSVQPEGIAMVVLDNGKGANGSVVKADTQPALNEIRPFNTRVQVSHVWKTKSVESEIFCWKEKYKDHSISRYSTMWPLGERKMVFIAAVNVWEKWFIVWIMSLDWSTENIFIFRSLVFWQFYLMYFLKCSMKAWNEKSFNIFEFIRGFIREFTCEFIRRFICGFIRDFIREFIHEFIREFIRKFIREFIFYYFRAKIW